MEMLDVYTHEGVRTGKLVERGRRYKLGDDEYTMVIHAFIYHRDHGFLVQKRAATKRVLPGAWCMTMGVVQAGEDSESGMRREVREELGLEIAEGQLRNCVRTYNGHKIVDIYLIYTDAEIEDMTLQEEEVEQVCWMSGRELLARFGGKNTRLHEEYVACMQRYVHVTHKAEKRRRRRQNARLAKQGNQA